MSFLLFEDSHTDQLRPITSCRPAYAIQCGGLRLIDVVTQLVAKHPLAARQLASVGQVDADEQQGFSLAAESRSYLRDVQECDFPNLSPRETAPRRVLLNARLVPDIDLVPIVGQLLEKQLTGAVWTGDQLAMAILPQSCPLPDTVATHDIAAYVRELQLPDFMMSDELLEHIALLEYPHSVIAKHHCVFANNLTTLASSEMFTEISEGVYVQADANLGPYVVTDTSRGPILLESGSIVGPFTFLAGPLLVGTNSIIHARTTIHPYVSLGSTVKIGGEVESSIIESYSNKQHHGYLGHSYLGSWVNLGAGTSNSNLKNTYGQVNMTVAGKRIPTGMRLMGCVVGDYSKTAINTSILTGCTIGVAAMLYGFVSQDVPSFVNYAHQFGDISSVSLESAITTQQRMFARRHVTHRDCDVQLLTRLFDQTVAERGDLECRPPRF